jgi:hypothetical protein
LSLNDLHAKSREHGSYGGPGSILAHRLEAQQRYKPDSTDGGWAGTAAFEKPRSQVGHNSNCQRLNIILEITNQVIFSVLKLQIKLSGALSSMLCADVLVFEEERTKPAEEKADVQLPVLSFSSKKKTGLNLSTT